LTWERVQDLAASLGGLAEEEEDRLGALIVTVAKDLFRGVLPGLSHVVAERYLMQYRIHYYRLVSDALLHGPAHFREQAEAGRVELLGEEAAAAMVGRKDRK